MQEFVNSSFNIVLEVFHVQFHDSSVEEWNTHNWSTVMVHVLHTTSSISQSACFFRVLSNTNEHNIVLVNWVFNHFHWNNMFSTFRNIVNSLRLQDVHSFFQMSQVQLFSAVDSQNLADVVQWIRNHSFSGIFLFSCTSTIQWGPNNLDFQWSKYSVFTHHSIWTDWNFIDLNFIHYFIMDTLMTHDST